MFKNKAIVIGSAFLLAIVLFSCLSIKPKSTVIHSPLVNQKQHKIEKSEEMPIIRESNPLLASISNGIPQEHREAEYIKWLQSSFKILVGDGASGSGTLCYYNQKTNTAYVISCGHLWNGNMSAGSGEVWATVITWYHNNNKLPNPKKYPAKVIFYSNQAGYDCSLLAFNPDWVPQIYYPIARLRPIQRGERYHSVGCDHGTEVADYIVEVIDIAPDLRGARSIVTQYNSPRPGRSGGGLIDKKGYFLGICWATSRKDGTGLGYFTPLEAIHAIYKREGYEFLIGQPLPGIARRIPILDHNRPGRKYSENYILLPNL